MPRESVTTPGAEVSRDLLPAIRLMRKLGTLRAVEVAEKPEYVDVVVRLRVAK